MDHELIALDGRQDHELEEVAGAVGADEQPSVWFLSDIFDCERMVDSVEDVLVGDAMFARRFVKLHPIIVLRISASCGPDDVAGLPHDERKENAMEPIPPMRSPRAATPVIQQLATMGRCAYPRRSMDLKPYIAVRPALDRPNMQTHPNP